MKTTTSYELKFNYITLIDKGDIYYTNLEKKNKYYTVPETN